MSNAFNTSNQVIEHRKEIQANPSLIWRKGRREGREEGGRKGRREENKKVVMFVLLFCHC
jgi:hypothetical protein